MRIGNPTNNEFFLELNKINKISGILNGTTNYILSEMENSKESFSDVLKRAQKLGYAEPRNPKLDLNGYDALAKVKILSSLSLVHVIISLTKFTVTL